MTDTEEKFLGPGAVLHDVDDAMARFENDQAAARQPIVVEDAVPDAGVPDTIPTPTPVAEPNEVAPWTPATGSGE